MGSAPLGVGAPPVVRTNGSTLCGANPDTLTGPPITSRTRSRARVSAHSSTGPAGSPSAPTGTVEAHWPVIATACSASRSAPASSTTSRAASSSRTHHSDASWVAVPSSPTYTDTGRSAVRRTSPCNDTTATFGPPLPRSTARIQRSPMPDGLRPRASRARPRASRRGRPLITVCSVALPCGVPPKPYIAPDFGRLAADAPRRRPPRCAARRGTARRRRRLVLGRVMQKCSAGGSCSEFIRQPWSLSESLTR